MPIDWKSIRVAWEGGASKNQVAKSFGVSVSAITDHQHKESWSREAVSEGTPATVDLTEHPLVSVHDEVADLEAEVARLREELGQTKKEAEVPMLDTREDVIRAYGMERLEKIAAKRINRERKSDGFLAVEFDPGDKRLQTTVTEVIELMLERKTSMAGTHNLRTVKMAYPDKKSPFGYRLVAIPVEANFNNEKANPGANIRHYQAKGFLMAKPYRCMRGPCWAKAAVAPGGQFLYAGYCSQAHLADDPVANAKVIKGITGTQSVRMIPA